VPAKPQSTIRYPDSPAERNLWIRQRRPARNVVLPRRPYAQFVELERAADGFIVRVDSIFLTNRECPWCCLMCDLWQNTLETPALIGSIPEQIRWALEQLRPLPVPILEPDLAPAEPGVRHLKLYNSGSFFDRRAIPVEDLPEIARLVQPFDRVIVECHPALVNDGVLAFRDKLRGRLEVAMGLETVHEGVLEKLNKGMTLQAFAKAAQYLNANHIDTRAFILVKPPFLNETEALEWANRSVAFAFDEGISVAVLIPVRAGNGALEALQQSGEFSPPQLRTLEAALDHALQSGRGRILADLWNLELFSICPQCFPSRLHRLQRANLTQRIEPGIECPACRSQGVF